MAASPFFPFAGRRKYGTNFVIINGRRVPVGGQVRGDELGRMLNAGPGRRPVKVADGGSELLDASRYYSAADLTDRRGNPVKISSIPDRTKGADMQTLEGRMERVLVFLDFANVRNSSVTNLKINDENEEQVENQRIGGIAGYSSNGGIENCYVQNLDINIKSAVSTYTGGVLGFGNVYEEIRNCYAQGNINSDGNNIGGIVGIMSYGVLEDCYSMVNITSKGNYIGGVIGISLRNDMINVLNNVSIGNLYTTQGVENLGRIIGNNLEVENINYAYEKQLLNGYLKEETMGSVLLNRRGVLDLDLGDSYNYSGKENGVLPKLYNTNGTELLPNQTDIYLDSNTEIELMIESIEANKTNTTEAEISIRINNPKEVEITEIKIEDMENSIIRNATQNGITNIVIRATPKRYYDSYKLTEIKYKKNSNEDNEIQGKTEEEQIKEVETEINVQFYKEIYNYEDWQSIEDGTYQNYRLMSDIDFSGRDNVKSNITVNRLEAENNVYTLKNITLEFNEANAGFINNVKTSIRNIGFKNITIKNESNSGNYCGVIAVNNGELENLSFNNITIEANNMNYLGAVAFVSSGSIKNVTLDTVSIKGKGYIGGLAGGCDLEVTNVTGNNITILADGNYSGGIIGYAYSPGKKSQSNLNVINSIITGDEYVGGISRLLLFNSINK